MREITYVPEFPEYAKGVVNLRGNIIPIIDIRLRLKKEEIVGNGRKCIIITKINDSNLGFIVDSVSDVLNINNDDISNPKIGSDYVNTYITGMAKLNDKIILLMDLNKIINLEELIVDHAVNKDVKEG
jgi:purine-binding chemotaxis protein CheW